jgi:hypothetical protein
LELLTILYAMLAALTGFSVGEAAPQRQSLVASIEAQTAVIAIAAVHSVAATPTSYAPHGGRLLARQDVLASHAPPSLIISAPVAWTDYARRHL